MTNMGDVKSVVPARTYYLAVAAAALGGVVAGVVLAPRLASTPHESSQAEVFVRPVVAASSDPRTDPRQLAALEARLGQLEAANADRLAAKQVPPEADRAEPVDEGKAPDLSPEAARARFQAQIAERRARHANEPVDRPWARTAETGLQADLQRLGSAPGAGTFSLQKVECKTTSCAADLLFANYQGASYQSLRLLHEEYSQPCGTTVFAPEPSAPNEPYVLTLYFECDSRKAAAGK